MLRISSPKETQLVGNIQRYSIDCATSDLVVTPDETSFTYRHAGIVVNQERGKIYVQHSCTLFHEEDSASQYGWIKPNSTIINQSIEITIRTIEITKTTISGEYEDCVQSTY